MPVNDLTFNDLSAVLTSICQQATGQAIIAPTNTAEFVSVANTALKVGYDPLNTAISQVIGRRIFSIRPYTRKFPGLEISESKYGAITQKFQVVDGEFSKNDSYNLEDEDSPDMFTVKKPKVLQTNYYGFETYSDYQTIYREQLDCAMRGPDEFAQFLSMIMTNLSDRHEQAHEATARATICNLIGGKIKGDPDNVIHLLTEYNNSTGQSLTEETVLQSANYVPFIQFVKATVDTISDWMTERTVKYHMNVTGSEIARHSPKDRQRMYLYTPTMNKISSTAFSSVFNENRLYFGEFERVNFWQAISSPDTINVTPSYLNVTDGTVTTADSAVNQSHVMGVICDVESMGYATISPRLWTTPFNARGEFYNYWWHFTDRYYNDFTENAVVLLMD